MAEGAISPQACIQGFDRLPSDAIQWRILHWSTPMKTSFATAAFVAAAMLAALPAIAQQDGSAAIEIAQPWSPATPAGARVGAGYFVVKNAGGAPDTLLSVATDVAEKAEIHEMKVENGVMSMRPVEGGIPVAAGATVELKPGGYHIMLMGLKEPLQAGHDFAATLTFEKAGAVPVEFEVRGKDATGHGAAH